MKLLSSVAIHLLLVALLGVGIIMMVHGKPALLIAGVLCYGILFGKVGCAVCHVPTLSTAPAGTTINGGKFTVPPALGNKTFHPFGDFLLHDVGTGDGIEQEPAGAAEIRTPALWGLRLRRPLLHDGSAATPAEAIERHGGEAAGVVARFRELAAADRQRLLDFLGSL